MDGAVTAGTHRRTLGSVAVPGGELAVGVWEPTGPVRASILAVHGVTSSHLAFSFLPRYLPGVRIVAPDLRGRGGSRDVRGEAGLAAHADDLRAVLDACALDRPLVVGHSMGAFVSVVLAARHPERVASLVLVDGGLPLAVPAGLSTDEAIAVILGPTAERLAARYDDLEGYLPYWRAHPAFQDAWSPELDAYVAYDLVPDGAGRQRPATTIAAMRDDTADMTAGRALPDALGALGHDALLLTAPRGLRDETPGLYPEAHLRALLDAHPAIRHRRIEGVNHYTIVMGDAGARTLAGVIEEELGSAARREA